MPSGRDTARQSGGRRAAGDGGGVAVGLHSAGAVPGGTGRPGFRQRWHWRWSGSVGATRASGCGCRRATSLRKRAGTGLPPNGARARCTHDRVSRVHPRVGGGACRGVGACQREDHDPGCRGPGGVGDALRNCGGGRCRTAAREDERGVNDTDGPASERIVRIARLAGRRDGQPDEDDPGGRARRPAAEHGSVQCPISSTARPRAGRDFQFLPRGRGDRWPSARGRPGGDPRPAGRCGVTRHRPPAIRESDGC